jgi:hypothetical protein
LFYETLDNRMMVVDYGVDGGIFRAQKARVWSDHTIFDPGVSNVDIAPDGKRFVVLALPQAATGEGTALHATMLLNYFDELKRRIP